MKKSEILREAKQHLYTGTKDDDVNFLNKEGFQYICWAIDHVCYGWPNMREISEKKDAGDYLTLDWIPELFGDENIGSLEQWLVKNKHVKHYKDIKHKDAQACRHRWIDWMIKYWEEKEREDNP